jgi:hypothetical protein
MSFKCPEFLTQPPLPTTTTTTTTTTPKFYFLKIKFELKKK